MEDNNKGQFNSNFGFLMASLGSAVGLGNLWSFPYKMGIGGGFAFLLIYIILAVIVGYPLMLSEITLGRKTQKAAIEAYKEADHRFTFNGVLQTAVPWFLIAFYCTFGGYITKYLVDSVIGLFSSKTDIESMNPGQMFGDMISVGQVGKGIMWMVLFLALTTVIVFGGVSGGIEKFCKVAMPALFFLLIIVVIRSCTLPGAGPGLKFLFSPDLTMWKKSFFDVVSLAGGQMFFSTAVRIHDYCIPAHGICRKNLPAHVLAAGILCSTVFFHRNDGGWYFRYSGLQNQGWKVCKQSSSFFDHVRCSIHRQLPDSI